MKLKWFNVGFGEQESKYLNRRIPFATAQGKAVAHIETGASLQTCDNLIHQSTDSLNKTSASL